MKLSVLDQSPIKAGGTAADAIRETVELARLCDSLGYHRYWVAEHHASDGLAGTAPEILIARIAAGAAETPSIQYAIPNQRMASHVLPLPTSAKSRSPRPTICGWRTIITPSWSTEFR